MTSSAFGNKLRRAGVSVRYFRFPRLIEQLSIVQGEDSLPRLHMQLSRISMLTLHDCLIASLNAASAREFLELVDDRIGKISLIITSQFPVDFWHNMIGEPTLADAALDQVTHVSRSIAIKGGSMRKRKEMRRDKN